MIKKNVYRSVIFIVCFGFGVDVSADTRCEYDQLNAVAAYCRSLLNCDANYLGYPAKDPVQLKILKCLSNADATFTKRYFRSLDNAYFRGSDCAYSESSDMASELFFNDVLTLSQILEEGWYPQKALNKFYLTSVRAVATACYQTLTIEAAFARNGKAAKRASALFNTQKNLKNKLDRLIAKSSFAYQGASSEEIIQALDSFTNNAVAYIRPGQTGGFSLNGQAILAESLFIDSDTNNPDVEPVFNDYFDEAQALPVPSIVGGYVNQPFEGELGNNYATGDIWDLYRVSMVADQVITLSIGEGADQADLDLYLYDSNGNKLDVSEGVTDFETLLTSAAGEYYVGVHAYSGASNYALSFGQQNTNQSVPPNAEFVPGEIIVKLKNNGVVVQNGLSRSAQALQTASTLGMTSLRGAPDREMLWKLSDDETERQQGLQALGVQVGTKSAITKQSNLSAQAKLAQDTLHTVKALRGRADVASADLNYIRKINAIPNDPHYARQWHYPLLSLPSAWDVTTGQNAIVAVIDTGVLLNHPDLQGQFVAGYDFISNRNVANDGDGIDNNPNDNGDSPGTGSHSYHGTHVAGTIAAASNNSKGVAGVAWNAKILPLRVLGVGGGTDYDISQAVRFAAGLSNDSGKVPEKRADVINLSLGGGGSSFAAQKAFNDARAAGVIIVAAAGNESTSAPSYPAAYEGVISVSAVDPQKQLAPYSNFGNKIDVSAPGGDTSVDRNGDGFSDGVMSTLASGDGTDITYNYKLYQGTSMATPHMAGVVALMKSANPDLTPAQMDTLLADSQLTEDIGNAGWDSKFGYGLINAQLAVEAVAGGGNTPSEPKLGLAPSGLNFGASDGVSSLSLNIFNSGTGELKVNSVLPNQTWLTVKNVSVDENGLGNYAIEVDRSMLAEGVHSATLTVNASTGVSSVPVMLRKGGNTVSDAGLNYYLLINAATSATLQTKVLADEGHYQLTFSQVPKGEYFLLGGTDMDNDGFICEGGELCGGYPSVEQLLPIKISEDVADLKFSANFSQSLQIVTGASLKNNSKLLAKMSKTNGVARPKSQKQTGYKRIDGQVVSD